jgi:hypothetical protein
LNATRIDVEVPVPLFAHLLIGGLAPAHRGVHGVDQRSKLQQIERFRWQVDDERTRQPLDPQGYKLCLVIDLESEPLTVAAARDRPDTPDVVLTPPRAAAQVRTSSS